MGKQNTIARSIKNILAQEGPQGLYRGASAIALGRMVQRGVVMCTYELVYALGEHNEKMREEIAFTGGL